ncbi:MAG TPA: ROK family protein [Bacteroidota bacterium]|nr:ROK family protein [Bacteroidota bacterium]
MTDPGEHIDYCQDKRTVLTLDAGGTNLVFTAIRGNKQIVDAITLPSHADDLDECIASIVLGFTRVKKELPEPAVAISFAFPGPADYPRGVIGDLGNLPGFRGGVALGPMLQEKFQLPVFINNDGDLYAYGEATAGYLPFVNRLLAEAGSSKRYKNLLGLTLGTGFGAGIVHDGRVLFGDNSSAANIWLFRDKVNPSMNVEEHASIRGVRRTYARETGIPFEESPSPEEIYQIAVGRRAGKKKGALRSFAEMAEVVGDAIATAVSLVDGLVVIGGGLAGAAEIFLPLIVKEMNSEYITPDGKRLRRSAAVVCNLEEPTDLKNFLLGTAKEIAVYGTNKKIQYDPEARIGVGVSKIGTSTAISIGAYVFALNALDK